MSVLSIGDLIPDGEFQLHSKFNDVVNFTCNDLLVSVVNNRIGEGPLNILLSTNDLNSISSIKKANKSLYINNQEFKLKPELLYNSNIDFCKNNQDLSNSLQLLEELIILKSHPKSLAFLIDSSKTINFTKPLEKAFVKHMLHACELLKTVSTTAGLKSMKGCGFGLTPSGDDFISGFLAGLNFKLQLSGSTDTTLLDEILNLSKGQNIFSNTFLHLSHGGHLIPRVKTLLSAILANNLTTIENIFNNFLKYGETSGSDFLVGLHFSLNGDADEYSR
jgi:hypothetical protein